VFSRRNGQRRVKISKLTTTQNNPFNRSTERSSEITQKNHDEVSVTKGDWGGCLPLNMMSKI